MRSTTLQTLLRYLSWNALSGIKNYGVGWLIVALFTVLGLSQNRSENIGIVLFVGVLASQKLVDHWRQRLECSTRTIIPHFFPVQSRALLIWHMVFSVLTVLLLVRQHAAPLVAIALGLASVWIGAWVMLRYSAPFRLLRTFWSIIPLVIMVAGILIPKRVEYYLHHGGSWSPVLLIIDVFFMIAAVGEMQRDAGEMRATVKPDTWVRFKKIMDWRLGDRFSTLPLPPARYGMPVYILISAVMACLFVFYIDVKPQAFNEVLQRIIVVSVVGIILSSSLIDAEMRFTQARATWSSQWLIPISDSRSGFAGHIVGGFVRELSVIWLNVAIIFVIAAVTLLHKLPISGYGAILAAMAAVMLGATMLVFLPAIWRYRGSMLVHGVTRIAVFLIVLLGAVFVASILAVANEAWPMAIFSGSGTVALISIALLSLSVRGLARSDLE